MRNTPVYANLSGIFPESSLSLAQRKGSNRLVSESPRPKFNLALPRPLMDEFEKLAESYGPGRKWMVLSAAIARFLGCGREERDEWVELIARSDLRKDYKMLIGQTQALSDSEAPASLTFAKPRKLNRALPGLMTGADLARQPRAAADQSDAARAKADQKKRDTKDK